MFSIRFFFFGETSFNLHDWTVSRGSMIGGDIWVLEGWMRLGFDLGPKAKPMLCMTLRTIIDK